jgi:hypothetical protein
LPLPAAEVEHLVVRIIAFRTIAGPAIATAFRFLGGGL